MGCSSVGDLGSTLVGAHQSVSDAYEVRAAEKMSEIETLQKESQELIALLQAIQAEHSKNPNAGIDLKNIPDYLHKLHLLKDLLNLAEGQTFLSKDEVVSATENLRLEIQNVNAQLSPKTNQLYEFFNQRKDMLEQFNKLLEKYLSMLQNLVQKQRVH